MLRQYIMFAGVGAIGTAAHYLVLVLLVELIDTPPVVATTLAYVVGAVVNYLLNYHYTFSSDKPHLPAISKFFTIAFIGMLFNGAIMDAGIRSLGLNYMLAQIAATAVVLQWNFFANKIWTFASK